MNDKKKKKRFSYPSIIPKLHYKPAENHGSEHSHIPFLKIGTDLKQNWINERKDFCRSDRTGALLIAIPLVTLQKRFKGIFLMAKSIEPQGPWFSFIPGSNYKGSHLFLSVTFFHWHSNEISLHLISCFDFLVLKFILQCFPQFFNISNNFL